MIVLRLFCYILAATAIFICITALIDSDYTMFVYGVLGYAAIMVVLFIAKAIYEEPTAKHYQKQHRDGFLGLMIDVFEWLGFIIEFPLLWLFRLLKSLLKLIDF